MNNSKREYIPTFISDAKLAKKEYNRRFQAKKKQKDLQTKLLIASLQSQLDSKNNSCESLKNHESPPPSSISKTEHITQKTYEDVEEIGFVVFKQASDGTRESFYRLISRRESKTFRKVNYRLKHPNGGTIAQMSKKVFTKEQIAALYASTQRLRENYPPESGMHEQKKVSSRHHLGEWRKYSKIVFRTKNSLNEHSKQWIEENERTGFFDTLRRYVEKNMPDLYKAYEKADSIDRIFHPFNAVAINYGITSRHVDKNDPEFGHAFVIPFGSYSKGELILENVMTGFDLRPGDIGHFEAARITHYNENVEGERFSLVFFTDKNSFFESLSEKPEELSDPLALL